MLDAANASIRRAFPRWLTFSVCRQRHHCARRPGESRDRSFSCLADGLIGLGLALGNREREVNLALVYDDFGKKAQSHDILAVRRLDASEYL